MNKNAEIDIAGKKTPGVIAEPQRQHIKLFHENAGLTFLLNKTAAGYQKMRIFVGND
ncbi:hypothetical protein [Candidatus Pantoea soli]|uniref:hypothetical protein n=1 Tax=Candidatus Pantoea soli TaxID=3098669 RepID=UPI0016476FB7|nr:hypothetical protein [Pantoea soli]